MRLFKATLLVSASFVFLNTSALAYCYHEASQRFGVNQQLLQAIAQQESGGRSHVVHTNPNGSRDIGLMQINSTWLPTLHRYGIREVDLYDPCVSVWVGAWILSHNFSRLGYTLQGLGAYNATTPWKRERYAKQVLKRMAPTPSYEHTTHPF